MNTYRVNEIYASIQGEGKRAGEASIFLRFSGCNMKCEIKAGPLSPGGFDCDTEFVSGRTLATTDIIGICLVERQLSGANWIVATGGEPGLQLDADLIEAFHKAGFKIQIETNGSIELPCGIDFITVSPKVAEHCIRQIMAHEVKYVRGYGQALPKTAIIADHYLISPAFNGNSIDQRTLEWCKELVKDSKWELSLQLHKLNNVR